CATRRDQMIPPESWDVLPLKLKFLGRCDHDHEARLAFAVGDTRQGLLPHPVEIVRDAVRVIAKQLPMHHIYLLRGSPDPQTTPVIEVLAVWGDVPDPLAAEIKQIVARQASSGSADQLAASSPGSPSAAVERGQGDKQSGIELRVALTANPAPRASNG